MADILMLRWWRTRKMRWAVRKVAYEHAGTCPGETLTVSRFQGKVLMWNRTTNHSSGFCFSRAAMIYVSEYADQS